MAPELDQRNFVRLDEEGKVLPPEKLFAAPGFSSSVDMWAFGVILLELARSRLWRADHKVFLCDLACGDPNWTCKDAIESLSPEMQVMVGPLIEACLTRLPEDRPTATSLLMHPTFAAFGEVSTALSPTRGKEKTCR